MGLHKPHPAAHKPIKVALLAVIAVTGGFIAMVGNSGLTQTNEHLCELWRTLPLLPSYQDCEFQYILVYAWFGFAIIGAAYIFFELLRWALSLRNRNRRVIALSLILAFFVCGAAVTGVFLFKAFIETLQQQIASQKAEITNLKNGLVDPPNAAPPKNLTQEEKDKITAPFRDQISQLTGELKQAREHQAPSPAQAQLDANQQQLEAATRERDALKAEVNDLKNGVWRPFAPGPILTHRFTPKQARDLLDRLDELTDVVRSAQSFPSIIDLLPGGMTARDRYVATLQSRGFPEGIERLKKYKAALDDFSNALNVKIRTENGKYAEDLSRIVGTTNINELGNGIGYYISRLDALMAENNRHPQTPLSREIVKGALDEPLFQVVGPLGKFEGWSRAFVRERSPAAAKEIERLAYEN